MRPPPAAVRQPASFPQVPAVVFLGGILALAIVLRFLHLGRQSFWVDEGTSVYVALLPWRSFLSYVWHTDPNMTLYLALLRFWLSLGYSEFAVRSLSVLASAAGVVVVYALGARLFDRRVGLLGALLAAINAFHIQYAQEARSYSFLVFLAGAASLSFVAGIERPSLRNWTGYVVASVLAVYSHVFAALLLIAHWSSLLVRPRREIPWGALLVSTLAIVVLVLPLAYLGITTSAGQLGWLYRPTWGSLPRVISTLLGSGGYLPPSEKGLLAWPEIARRVLVLVYFVLLAVALTRAARVLRVRLDSLEAWHYALLVSWAFIPILLAFCLSVVTPLFHPRYLIVCLPALVLLAALGLSTLDRRWALFGLLALITALSGLEVSSYYTHAVKEDWRAAARYVVSRARPGDEVVIYAVGSRVFSYYRDHLVGPVPPGTARITYAIRPRDAVAFATKRFSFRRLEELATRSGAIWFVRKDDWTMPSTRTGPVRLELLGQAIEAELGRHHVVAEAEDFAGGIHVRLYRSP